jgi:flagellar hook-length control protein FliK
MNLNSASFQLTQPPAPPEPPKEVRRTEPSRHDDGAERAEKAERAEREFENALRDELRRKQGGFLPMPLPWIVQQAQTPVTDKEQGIEAANGVGGVTGRPSPWLSSPLVSTARPAAIAVEGELEVLPVQEPKSDIGEVQLLVEANLPPVQPLQTPVLEPTPVHVVDFPQVVTGTVQKMVKDNQPITQLDFEISPPHIGPVNLQVQLQGSAVNVQLVALTLQAKQALESQIGSITNILQAHSFTPGQIKVVTAAGGKAGASGAGQKGDQTNFNFFQGGRSKRSASEQESMSVGKA